MTEFIFTGVCEDCIHRHTCKDASKAKIEGRKLPAITLSCSDYVSEGEVEL